MKENWKYWISFCLWQHLLDFLKIFSGFPRSVFQILASTLIPCCTSHLLFFVEHSYWKLPSYLSKGSPSIQRHVRNDIPCIILGVSKYNMRCYFLGWFLAVVFFGIFLFFFCGGVFLLFFFYLWSLYYWVWGNIFGVETIIAPNVLFSQSHGIEWDWKRL